MDYIKRVERVALAVEDLDAARVTIGRHEENEEFVAALRAVLEEAKVMA